MAALAAIAWKRGALVLKLYNIFLLYGFILYYITEILRQRCGPRHKLAINYRYLREKD